MRATLKKLVKQYITKIITWQAMYVLKRFKPTVIAVTGNVGKTSTKDAIFYALRPYGHVRRSEKSFNSDTGVPLSILGVPNGWNSPMLWATNILHGFMLMFFTKTYPEYLVLEIGADHPGDISSVAAWVKPHVSVFTRFPDVPVHIEFFENVEAVIREKTSLATHTRKDGTLILNADDSKIMKLDGLDGRKTYTYSAENPSDIQIKNITYHFSETDAVHGSDTTLLVKDRGEIHLVLPHIISHGHIAGAVSGLLVVKALGFEIEDALLSLREYRTPPGRFSLLEGVNETLLIDDAYNASPTAMEHALMMLKEIPVKKGKKVAILGDMMELGVHTQSAHEKLGEEVLGVADVLIAVGSRAEFLYKSAIKAGFNKKNAFHVFTTKEVFPILEKYMTPGSVILFKASQSVRLERVIKDVMTHPEQAGKLLVRQDKEWQER
jgi:UDP-N-acetylmuramyl pentapeptide synthase